MFTGIVQAKVSVVSVKPSAGGARLTLDHAGWLPRNDYHPVRGDSICVNGVCLTVTETEKNTLAFDVVAQTLEHTTLGRLQPGDGVNLEPAVTARQPLGGHFMQGHVDGVGEVVRVQWDERECRVTIAPPPSLICFVISKGSIALDGVSLTVAAVGEADFEVALIPTTLDMTTLNDWQAGDAVNVETDILSKTVVTHLRRQVEGGRGESLSPITWDLLRSAGFMREAENDRV